MIAVGIDFVVPDSLEALALYERVRCGARGSHTLCEGSNEVIFSLYGTRFHMLDAKQTGSWRQGPNGVVQRWSRISQVHKAALEPGSARYRNHRNLPWALATAYGGPLRIRMADPPGTRGQFRGARPDNGGQLRQTQRVESQSGHREDAGRGPMRLNTERLEVGRSA